MGVSTKVLDGFALVAACLILAVILFPFRAGSFRMKPTKEYNLAQQVEVAVAMYARDNDDHFPPIKPELRPSLVLAKFLRDPKNGTVDPDLGRACDYYIWNFDLSTKPLAKLFSPKDTWLFHAKLPDSTHNVILGFSDGHVKYVTRSRLLEIITAKRLIFRSSTH